MTYDLYWHTQGRILIAAPRDALTLEEIVNTTHTVETLLEEGQKPVHVILDAREVQSFPVNPKKLIENASWLKHPVIGWVIIMTNHQTANMLIHIVTQALKLRYRSQPDMETALHFLYDVDETLPKP